MRYLLILFLIISSLANAQTYSPSTRYYSSYTSSPFSSASDACVYSCAHMPQDPNRGTISCAIDSYNICQQILSDGSKGNGDPVQPEKYCTGGGALNGAQTQCEITCPSGQTFFNGSCQSQPQCTSSQVYNPATNSCDSNCAPLSGGNTSYFANTASGANGCVDGCEIVMDGGNCGQNAAGVTGCFYDGHYNGQSCSGSTTPSPSNDPAFDCIKKGMSYGTVNGSTVCLPIGSKSSAPVTQKSTSSTTTQNPNVPAVTTDTTTTTTCDGATCTTSKTSSSGVSSQKTQDVKSFCEENPNSPMCKQQDDFCQKHPDLQICKNSSINTGSCSSFSCDGDAIQCAIAKEQHDRGCELFDKQTNLTDLGTSMLDGTDNLVNPAKSENHETHNLSDAIQEGNNIGGGTFQDAHFSVAGTGFDIPFSRLNFFMQLLGQFILAAAYLNAARIVGVRGST